MHFRNWRFWLVPFKTTQRLTDSWCKCIHCTRCWSLKDPKDDDVSDESFEGFTLYLGKGDARMQLASRSQRSLNYRPFVGAALYYLRELLLFITLEYSKGHMWHSGFIDDVCLGHWRWMVFHHHIIEIGVAVSCAFEIYLQALISSVYLLCPLCFWIIVR